MQDLMMDVPLLVSSMIDYAVEFLDELPHTGTGKVYKLALRETFADHELAE